MVVGKYIDLKNKDDLHTVQTINQTPLTHTQSDFRSALSDHHSHSILSINRILTILTNNIGQFVWNLNPRKIQSKYFTSLCRFSFDTCKSNRNNDFIPIPFHTQYSNYNYSSRWRVWYICYWLFKYWFSSELLYTMNI